MVEDSLAGRIMEDITAALIEKLALSVDQQRLDSTHIQSNMAQFGRTRSSRSSRNNRSKTKR